MGLFLGEIGNTCIAAHNYDDDRFFGNLNKLQIGDIIDIYMLDGSKVSYSVYTIYETVETDTSCTNQNTNGASEITLITCNNVNGNRVVVKAFKQ